MAVRNNPSLSTRPWLRCLPQHSLPAHGPVSTQMVTYFSFPRMVSDTPQNHHCSLSRVKILLPGDRTLSSLAAGLFPPGWQDSFLLPSGGILSSSQVAGLFPPPWWQDSFLLPGGRQDSFLLPGGRTLSSTLVAGLFPPPRWQDSFLHSGGRTLSSSWVAGLFPPPRWRDSFLLPGGRTLSSS